MYRVWSLKARSPASAAADISRPSASTVLGISVINDLAGDIVLWDNCSTVSTVLVFVICAFLLVLASMHIWTLKQYMSSWSSKS